MLLTSKQFFPLLIPVIVCFHFPRNTDKYVYYSTAGSAF